MAKHDTDEDEVSVAPRFDAANYEHYDEADVLAVSAFRSSGRDQSGAFREDADGIFFARQLDYVRSRIYERKYPAMVAGRLVPDSTEAPEWAETITTKVYDEVGIAKVIANYADDLPRVDVRGVESTVRVRTIGDSYGYNIAEIKASRATGQGLDVRRAAVARRAIEQKINRVKLKGDADYNLLGLINNPNIGETTGLTGEWADPTTDAAEILADLNALWIAVNTQSKGVHVPDTFVIATTDYTQAATKPLAGFPGMTAMMFFKGAHPEVNFVQAFEMVGAGTSGNLIMLYELNEENLRHELVQPFNQLPVQERNLEFIVNCTARTAGVQIDYPLAFTKGNL